QHIEKINEGQVLYFFFSSRRRHTRSLRDWSSDGVLFRSTVSRFSADPVIQESQLLARVRTQFADSATTNPFNSIRWPVAPALRRSEERRVGKECRSRWAGCSWKGNMSYDGCRGRYAVVWW